MTLNEAIANRICEECRMRAISVNRLANISGITQSTLNNIVHSSSSPTVSTVKKVCDGLEISMEDFFSSPLFTQLEQEVK
jgi:Helix-turn-helix.